MKRNIVIAVVTAAALVGGGTATALAVAGDDENTTSVTRTDDDRDDRDDRQDRDDDRDDDGIGAAAPASGKVTAAEAIAAALDHTPGTAVSAELDDGSWEIDVLAKGDTWHTVRIAPDTGKVLGAHQDDEDDAAEVRAALKNASVTAEQAARAAESKGPVVSVDLDDDGDDRAWDTETRASGGEREWKVDLRSGAVVADRDDD